MTTATQKRLLPLLKLHTMFGGTIREAGAGNAYFNWQLSTVEMVVAIPWLMPHIVLKREEAEIVLSYAKTVKQSRVGRVVSDEDIAHRTSLVNRLREIREAI